MAYDANRDPLYRFIMFLKDNQFADELTSCFLAFAFAALVLYLLYLSTFCCKGCCCGSKAHHRGSWLVTTLAWMYTFPSPSAN